jgi:hypothetical protein
MAVVIGSGVAVAEQHGDHEDVPGQLQREVAAGEDAPARCLDRGEDRVELEAGHDPGRVLALPGVRGLRGAAGRFRGRRGDVDPTEV